MKKGIAMLMITALLAGTLAGCGGNTDSESASSGDGDTQTESDAQTADDAQAADDAGAAEASEETELVVAWWGNQLRNEKTQQMLDLYSEQNPAISFDGQFSEWADYWNKLATASAGNSLPDIIQMDYKYIQQYVDNGLLVDLQPYVDDGTLNLSDCSESAVASGNINGGLYALTIGIASPALFYNKTVTDELGIEVKDNMTMDEFKDICREIYEKKGLKTNINYANNEQFIEYMLRAQDLVVYDGDKLGGDSADPYIEFFKLYEDGIKEGWHVEPSIFTERTIGSMEQDPLVYGSSGDSMSWCAFQYSSLYAATTNAAPEGMEIGITTWPSDNSQKSNYLKPTMFWAVTKDCKNPKEAVKFLDFFTNNAECQMINSAERGMPIAYSRVADVISEADEETKAFMNFVQTVVEPACSTINPPLPAKAAEANDLLNKLEEQVCYGQLSAEDAGNQFYEQANAILKDE